MIFKRKSKLVMMVCILFSCVILVVSSASGAGQPGSDTDPLVSKSYVDQQIAKLTAQIGSGSSGTGTGTVDSGAIAQLQTDMGDLTKFIIDALTEIETLKTRVASLESGYTVVEAKAGQKVLLSGGSEALLRSGKATAIKGVNGVIVDASSGLDLNDGVNIPVQHLLISARTDGRGLLIKANAFLLIRGAYTIQ